MRSSIDASLSLLILIFIPRSSANSIWDFDIDKNPDRLASSIPPFSASAVSNPALLSIQIACIVAAYFGTILVIGLSLLTFGRRLRRTALHAADDTSMEMVKPKRKASRSSPDSAQNNERPWYSPRQSHRWLQQDKPGPMPKSPGVVSVTSFDERVLEEDKKKRQDELETLYAAVMMHEQRRSTSSMPCQRGVNETQQARRRGDDEDSDYSRPSSSGDDVSESPVHTMHSIPEYIGTSQESGAALTIPLAPHSNASDTDRSTSGAHLSSSLSRNCDVSVHERDLQQRQESDRRATTPQEGLGNAVNLSHQGSAATSTLLHDDMIPESPSTPASYGSKGPLTLNKRRGSPAISPVKTSLTGEIQTDVTGRSSVPRVNVQTPRTPAQISSPRMLLDNKNNVMSPIHVLPQSPRAWLNPGPSSTSASGSLPFRSMPHSLLSPGITTKTTYLERRRDGTAPWAGQATPYSPYMPFTPLTPVTPRLLSRQERKQREKDEGKRALAAKDQVIDEKEMWGDVY